jgi:hypothetical protein
MIARRFDTWRELVPRCQMNDDVPMKARAASADGVVLAFIAAVDHVQNDCTHPPDPSARDARTRRADQCPAFDNASGYVVHPYLSDSGRLASRPRGLITCYRLEALVL